MAVRSLLVVLAVLLGVAPWAQAQLTPPTLMPGFPMLAGNIVMIMWVPVPGAAKYNVMMNDQKIGEAVAPPFQGPAPEAGGEYRYTIVAVGADGAVSGPSGAGVVKIISLEPPKSAEARLFGETIALRWDASPGAAIYNVYRSTEPGGKKQAIASVNDLSYKDPNVQDGKTYYYQIAAKDAVGKESKLSAEFSAQYVKEVKASAESEKIIPLVIKKTTDLGLVEFFGTRERIAIPNDIMVGPDGLVYLLDPGNDNIKVMDAGVSTDPRGLIPFPADLGPASGMGMDVQGNLYVTFPNVSQVIAFAPDGRVVLKVTVPPSTKKEVLDVLPPGVAGSPPLPIDVAVDPDGRIFVADQNYSRVVVFDGTGRYVDEFGKRGKEKGDVANPLTLAAGKDGSIYVGDPINKRVGKFDKDLKLVGYIGNPLPSPGSFLGIRGMNFNEADQLVVVDPAMVTIQAFDTKTLEYLFSYGNETAEEMGEGGRASVEWQGPPNVAVDRSRRLYIPQTDGSVFVRQVEK